MVKTVSAETRRDLLQAVRERYRAGTKEDKRRILDEMADPSRFLWKLKMA